MALLVAVALCASLARSFTLPRPPTTRATSRLRSSNDVLVLNTDRDVLLFDTTLRDGTQGESISCSVEDKLKIAARLAEFGMDFIECGWPGSNPKDAEFFRGAATELDANARDRLVAFGSTRSKRSATAAEDAQLRALVASGVGTACIVCKASSWQTTEILGATRASNLDMISSSVAFLVDEGLRVHVDLEHFYDGFLGGRAAPADPAYSLACAEAAAALARSASVRAGASVVQGTVNGVGERTGNANLVTIAATLALKGEALLGSAPSLAFAKNLPALADTSRFVDEALNLAPNPARPYVGASAFAHKGGLHVSAVAKDAAAYEHVDPAAVGNAQRVLASELSGRANIWSSLQKAGLVDDGSEALGEEVWKERAAAILRRVKALENLGYSFEGAEASVHLMLLHASPGYCVPFSVLDYSVTTSDVDLDSAARNAGQPLRDGGATARATVKVRVAGDDAALDVAEGTGPVDALEKALKRALAPTYPTVGEVELVDYKVRILDPQSKTSAATRVEISFRDGRSGATWTTVAVDRNIISASANALVDGFEFAVIEHAELCNLCELDYDDDGPLTLEAPARVASR
ncbi:alpha-IPM synthase homocitrate synthase-like protein [Aureococcus anophagefferens]|nr:alpha-IPM synthase homocitrate synthase-like protein [Aureococcus anophagefferens]